MFSLWWSLDKSWFRGLNIDSHLTLETPAPELCASQSISAHWFACKCQSQEVHFHFSATKNKSNLVTDCSWWRVKAAWVQMFHFIAASSQRCHQDVPQTLHMSPVCLCQAGSALTWVGKMAELGFKAFFPPYFFSTSLSARMPSLNRFVLLHCPDKQLLSCCCVFPSPVPAS